jgi:hypothetical protein
VTFGSGPLRVQPSRCGFEGFGRATLWDQIAPTSSWAFAQRDDFVGCLGLSVCSGGASLSISIYGRPTDDLDGIAWVNDSPPRVSSSGPGSRSWRWTGSPVSRPPPPRPSPDAVAVRDPFHVAAAAAKTSLTKIIGRGVPGRLPELATLGRTLTRRAGEVLACFDRVGTSNGPTEAINGRLERLRGTAVGFRNLTSYAARSLLETGGFRPRLRHGSG